MTAIALIPLDERPVCTSLPASIARISGLTCLVPPAELLPRIREPGDTVLLSTWLSQARRTASHAVVSLEGLGFGGLIPSRIGTETSHEVAARWNALRMPGCAVFGSVLVPRTPDSSDAMEEPDYWNPHGPALHRLSAALSTGVGVDEARAALPEAVRIDWISRRLRQQALALYSLELAADTTISRLVVGIDDAAEESLSACDQRALLDWVDRRELGRRVSVQPGADEIGAVLVARASLEVHAVRAPRIGIACSNLQALDRVAPYESSPVRETIRRQVEAAGGQAIFPDAGTTDVDAIMVIHPPELTRGVVSDWAVAPNNDLDPEQADSTVTDVIDALARTEIVGVADVGRPNGADPLLVAALDAADAWRALCGFAAWNTAGNTVGTVAAQLVATWAGRQAGTFDDNQLRLAVARRVVEDYGWMTIERTRVRAELGSSHTQHDHISPATTDNPVLKAAETRLGMLLAARPGFEELRITPDSLSLPWQRSFEIDLRLEVG
ncbi:DUF4127 family protein [Cryobacterium sp. SO1]|uniref:DUF4127 family protein n=1 Tax=Cryobacterium sp. SO1 TaxID=1897061 RepID=UPI001023E532|nr:DUF4127 family protein [Cryobacterium sp. SO1]RZI34574.1 hypothetical protein BJQ95_03032 [Cryobacterium sp. SO1]